MKKKSSIDMTVGNPISLILRFSLPLLAGNVLQQLYNMVDSMVVGNFVGANAFAAVNISFPIVFLLSSLFTGIGSGASVLISQFFGAGDMEKVQKTVDTIYKVTLIGAIPMTIIGLLVVRPLFQLIEVPESQMEMAVTYCLILFGGLIGSLGYNVNAGILQGLGDGKTPLIFLAISSAINVGLDLFLVAVIPWGVAGAAIATIMAQFGSWIFGVIYINKRIEGIQIRLKTEFHKDLMRRIIKLGVPTAVQMSQISVAMLIMQWVVNGFGDNFVAGFTAANKVDAFAFMPIQSLSVSMTTYVGQNIGAGKIERVKRGVRNGAFLSVGMCLAITAIVLPLMDNILLLFINDTPEITAAVLHTGRGYLVRVMPLMFSLAISFIVSGALRGAGQAIVPMIGSIFGMWLVRVPVAIILSRISDVPENMFWGFGIGWFVGICIIVPVYLRGSWQKNALKAGL
jgi:putative efflux protein, MATE family